MATLAVVMGTGHHAVPGSRHLQDLVAKRALHAPTVPAMAGIVLSSAVLGICPGVAKDTSYTSRIDARPGHLYVYHERRLKRIT